MSDIPRRAIVAVIGGYPAPGWRVEPRRVVTHHATHNSYDYTALISLLEYPDAYPNWTHVFLLHDTMELGPGSDRLIKQADPALKATAVWGGECNLALYRVDYLLSCRAQLFGLKNCSKQYAVDMEGFLWRQLPETERGSYPGGIAIGDVSAPYGGAGRQRVYYSGVDLIKWKANWGQIWPPSVVTP
jgi:hypothetical protein